MIRVSNVKEHSFKSWKDLPEGKNKDFHPLVTNAKLVLIDCGNEANGNFWLNHDGETYSIHSTDEGDRQYKALIKPMLVSEDEKIEVGDSYFTTDGLSIIGGIRKCEDSSYNFDNCYKVLALPEHFPQEYLQMIVDGKLNGGDNVLVECNQNSFDSETEYLKCKSGTFPLIEFGYSIKLNPHITIYSIGERMVPISLVEKAFDAGKRSVEPTIRFEKYGDMEAYPSLDLKYTYEQWFEKNIK